MDSSDTRLYTYNSLKQSNETQLPPKGSVRAVKQDRKEPETVDTPQKPELSEVRLDMEFAVGF